MPTNQEAYRQLIESPFRFLSTYLFQMDPSISGRESGVLNDVYFYQRGNGHEFNGEPIFRVGRFPDETPLGGPAVKISVWYVHMEHEYVPPMPAPGAKIEIQSPPIDHTTDDLRLLVTGSLTGCSLVFQRAPMVPKMAHLHPRNPPINGMELQNMLKGNVRFFGSTQDAEVYGREDYPQEISVNVVGVKKFNSWTIWFQERTILKPLRIVKVDHKVMG